jgi:predicted TIM-barrel fold metal-dependent hydrolase
MHPLITLEEHYVSKTLKELPGTKELYAEFPEPIMSKLQDLDEQRIANMDAGKVSVQVMSHGPITATPDQARLANNEVAEAIKKNPTRLRGFALLPVGEPKEAAKELERTVKDLGFVGTLIDNHHEGRYYDDEFFWPLFEKAQELDTVVYIHPTFPTNDMMPYYKGNYDPKVAMMLGIAGFGWHADTALHVLKLYAAGVFDRFPKLKIVIGHMGELLPFQLERTLRIDSRGAYGKHERSFKKVWDENIWITTSGMFSLNPLACMIRNTKLDRIMFSVDYPFSSNEQGLEFVEEMRNSGLLTEEQLLDISYRNAEKLLKVKAQT